MVNIAKKRILLQRLVQRADRTPADFGIAIETAEQIDAICNEAEILIEQGDKENAFILLWLVADELISHYEVIEETAQVYECLEDWASVTANVIEDISITEEKRQHLKKQLHSWDEILNEPLESLISLISE
jgi:hypothetical protein